LGLARENRAEGLLHITEDEQNSRLDRVLVRRLGSENRNLILRLIRKGNVRVNKKRAKPELRVQAGDTVFLPASLRNDDRSNVSSQALPAALLHQTEQLKVLYEDEHLLAVYKPAGMVVHGGSGYRAGLIEALKKLRKLTELRLAHRLDRDTSGVLLMAKNLASLRRLNEAFRERDMEKVYVALIAGHPFAHAGRMQSKLGKGLVRGGERMVQNDEGGKESVTDYQVMMECSHAGFHYALVALKPHSGRTHQLRVQLAAEGHAILGDGKYGRRDDNRQFRQMGGSGLALHAWRLRFVHPVTGGDLDIRAAWPEGWRGILLS